MSARRTGMGDCLQLRYAIRLRDGSEIVSNFDDAEPDTLTLGDGTLAPSLERWLIGLAVGERQVFLLDAAQAFGVSQAALVQRMPKADATNGVALIPGTLVEFTLPDGATLAGQILKLDGEMIEVDFNHPLADLAIEFEVEIVAIQNGKLLGTQAA